MLRDSTLQKVLQKGKDYKEIRIRKYKKKRNAMNIQSITLVTTDAL